MLALTARRIMPHVKFTHDAEWLRFEFACESASQPGRALFVALDTDPLGGCAVVPYAQHYEGSTVFLPFRADLLFALRIGDDGKPTLWRRKWERAKWSDRIETGDGSDFKAEVSAGKIALLLKRHAQIANATAWVKDTRGNYGWGEMLASVGETPLPRFGDAVLVDGFSLDPQANTPAHLPTFAATFLEHQRNAETKRHAHGEWRGEIRRHQRRRASLVAR